MITNKEQKISNTMYCNNMTNNINDVSSWQKISINTSQFKHHPRMAQIIGVGGCGCSTTKELFHTAKYTIPDAQFAIVNNDNLAICNIDVPQKYFVKTPSDGVRHIIGNSIRLLFIVAGMGGKYSAPMVSELCRQFHNNVDNADGFVKMSIVFSVMPFDFEGKKRRIKAEEGVKMIKEYATKVITLENESICRLPGLSPEEGLKQMTKCISDYIKSFFLESRD